MRKNKKVIIACIALVLIVIIATVVLIILKKSSNNEKKYVSGERTLVDTIAKDSGHSAEVYINSNQDIEVEIEDSAYANFYMMERPAPISNSLSRIDYGTNKTIYTVYIATKKDTMEEDVANAYPYNCEFVISSSVTGIEYKIAVSVDKEVIYKSGSMEQKEVDYNKVGGYKEYEESFGKLILPSGASPRDITDSSVKGEDSNGDSLDIKAKRVEYILGSGGGALYVVDSAKKDEVERAFTHDSTKKLTVNDTEVLVDHETGIYFAVYTIGKATYLNAGFAEVKEGDTDNTIIEALKPYIGK